MRGLALLAQLVFMLLGNEVLACECEPLPSESDPVLELEHGLMNVDTVFLGTVEDIKIVEDERQPRIPVYVSRISVRESFLAPEISVVITRSHPSEVCGIEFVEGSKYLIFGNKDSKGAVWVSGCSFTKLADRADRVVELLRKRGRDE